MRFFLCLLIAGGILSATLGSACGKKEIIVVDPPMGGDTTMVIDTVRKPKLAHHQDARRVQSRDARATAFTP